jgi:hypothetical protein
LKGEWELAHPFMAARGDHPGIRPNRDGNVNTMQLLVMMLLFKNFPPIPLSGK